MAQFWKDPEGNNVLKFSIITKSDKEDMEGGGWEKVTEAAYNDYNTGRASILNAARDEAKARAIAEVEAQFAEALAQAGQTGSPIVIATSIADAARVGNISREEADSMRAQARVVSGPAEVSPTNTQGTTTQDNITSGMVLVDVFGKDPKGGSLEVTPKAKAK
jgi:hypothetical protein